MNLEEYKKNNFSKYLKIPENLKILCDWYSWLKYDFLNNLKSDDYFTYTNFRYWLIQELDNWYDMSIEEIPEIKNNSDHMRAWFRCDRLINKNNLLKCNYTKDYSIKKTYHGVELSEN